MKDECLICGAPLKYLETDEVMECAVCHKKENSKTVCENGHYICNECHTQGMDSIVGVCIGEKSKNPIEIIQKMMALPFCHMHGPEHHVMVGSALLTAYKNAGGDIDLPKALSEKCRREVRKFPVALADSGEPAGQVSAQECLCLSLPARLLLPMKRGDFQTR